MKRFIFTVVIVIGLILPSIVFSQQTYPLYCKNGGNMVYYFDTPPNRMIINFEKSSWGLNKYGPNPIAGINKLPQGYCAWADRALRNEEPNQIIYMDFSDFSISWRLSPVRGNNEVTGVGGSDIGSMLRPNEVMLFDVYNDGNGNFIAKGKVKAIR
jgi:hypothetical protein